MSERDFMTGEELGNKLLAAAREISEGKGVVVLSPAIAARKASGVSQKKFARMLGVSVRTLQDWEQGRREPSGAAKTLLRVVRDHPSVLREAAA